MLDYSVPHDNYQLRFNGSIRETRGLINGLITKHCSRSRSCLEVTISLFLGEPKRKVKLSALIMVKFPLHGLDINLVDLLSFSYAGPH